MISKVSGASSTMRTFPLTSLRTVDSPIVILQKKGEGKIESRPLSQLRSGPDIPTMFFNQSLGNGKPQPCPPLFASLDLVKFIKNHMKFIFRDARPGVSNLEKNRLTVRLGHDRNLATVLCKF